MATPAGYSGTPLGRKLGLKPGFRVFVEGAPAAYVDSLAPLPAGLRFAPALAADVDLAHVFVTRRTQLSRTLASARSTLGPAATLWISWPKKSSRVPSEVAEGMVRELALPLGWVDVKVCAIDEVWSGLKLVLRKELR